MIDKVEIKKTLTELNRLFRETREPTETYYYSKLAILEFSGWIQTSIETIMTDCFKHYLKKQEYKAELQKSIHLNSGFSYDYLHSMLIKIIGYAGIEKLEAKMGTDSIAQMKSFLNNLYTNRNDLAHSDRTGYTIKIDAPSKILSDLDTIFPFLVNLEKYSKLIPIERIED